MATWLMLDIDGAINVKTSNRMAKLAGLRETRFLGPDGQLYRILYDPKIHAWLAQVRAAGMTPVWCSTWQDLAERTSGSPDRLRPLARRGVR